MRDAEAPAARLKMSVEFVLAVSKIESAFRTSLIDKSAQTISEVMQAVLTQRLPVVCRNTDPRVQPLTNSGFRALSGRGNMRSRNSQGMSRREKSSAHRPAYFARGSFSSVKSIVMVVLISTGCPFSSAGW